jgi:hypothetical protein
MSSEIKLSKADIDTLKSLYPINQTLKIVGGKTELRSVNETKTIALITNMETAFPRTFCIYDLREFISVLSLFDAPTLDFSNDKFVTVKSEDGRQKLKYVDGAENLINSYFEKDFKLPSTDVTVNVNAGQLKAVMGAAQTLKLEYIGFRTVDGKIYLSAFDRNNGSGDDTNGFSIEVGESNDTFELFYKTDALTVLDGDCEFEISSKKISKVQNGNKTFWVSLDANSTFA